MSTLYKRVVSTKSHKHFKVNIERYESVMEVVQHCKEREITDSRFHNQSERDEEFSDRNEWYGVSSYNEALDYLYNGYQPTVDKLNESIKNIKGGESKRMKFENNVYGFMPVVPLALMGVPNSMINTIIKPMKCKVVDVYYDIACNASVSSKTIIENGQKILGAIMELEKQGYKFNLYAVQTYNECNDADVMIVKIKSSRNPVDLKRMSFPLTHTAFFRVIGFDWYSKTPHGKFRSGYGYDLNSEFSKKEMNDFTKQVFGDNAIFIRGCDIVYDGKDAIKEELMSNEKIDKNR